MKDRPPSLVLAGLGAMAEGFLRLGGDYLKGFDRIEAFDRDPERVKAASGVNASRGDTRDEGFLLRLLKRQRGGFIFLNLLAGADNPTLRALVAARGGNYVDTGASAPDPQPDFCSLMEKSHSPADGPAQLIFSGVNPGMVEVAARMAASTHFGGDEELFDVELFERDTIKAASEGKEAAASWSPRTLADEIINTPTLTVERGRLRLREDGPSLKRNILWGCDRLAARLVAHEELWNMARKAPFGLRDSHFAYALSPRAMKVLDEPDAGARLIIPPSGYCGFDEVALKITSAKSGKAATLSWRTSHAASLRLHGLNAVQFQVASSLLFFLEYMERAGLWRERAVFCGSNIPLEGNWDIALGLMKKHGVEWRRRKTEISLEG